jgi:regulator of nucleoside diphosphate kinase
MNVVKNDTIILSVADHKRLKRIIESAETDSRIRGDLVAALEAELDRARVVPRSKVPAGVVTMNSVVRLRDLDSGETEQYELVFPEEADIAQNRISVLAPIGTAILGYRRGDIIEWPVPIGLRRLRVEKVFYQPERAGAVWQ